MKHFKKIPEGSHQHDMMKHAAATLGSGNLKLAVQLPEGEDLNEWIAVNSEGGRRGGGGSVKPQGRSYLPQGRSYLFSFLSQLLTSSIRSTCCTGRSRSTAQQSPAQS